MFERVFGLFSSYGPRPGWFSDSQRNSLDGSIGLARFGPRPRVPVLVVLLIEIVVSLRRGDVGLDIVAALSMLAALLFAEYLAAAVVAVMYSGGQYLESFAERRASREMTALLARVPRSALRQRNGGLEEVALEAIEPGDRLVIRKGDVVPVDGAVVEGVAVLDQSALTGKSMPVQQKVGDPSHERIDQCRRSLPSGGVTACGREHICRDRAPGRGCPAFPRTDVAPGGSIRHGVSGGDRRARRSGLGLERRSHSRRGGARGGDPVSAYPGGTGRNRVRACRELPSKAF